MSEGLFLGLPGWAMLAGGGILGAIIGSFLGAVVVRMPAGRAVTHGRSACDACGVRLGPGELIPLVSFALQRGRCRRCGAAIDPWQFSAEAGGALVGLASVLFAQDIWGAAWGMLLGWQLLLLCLLDLRHFWLPDRLTGLLAASGLGYGLWLYGLSSDLLVDVLAGGALGYSGLTVVRLAYRWLRGREGLGAGDPKLLGAIGLWVGPAGVIVTLLGGSMIALIGAAALLVAGRRIAAQTALPLGAALALAGWMVALLSGL